MVDIKESLIKALKKELIKNKIEETKAEKIAREFIESQNLKWLRPLQNILDGLELIE